MGTLTTSLYDEDAYEGVVPEGRILLEAAASGKNQLVAHLLKNATNLNLDINEVDEEGRSSLMLACANGHAKVASYLLQAGASPDLKDVNGFAAVHHCVFASANQFIGTSRAAACIRALGRFRSNMDRKTADGRSALHLAVQMSLTDITISLKEAGANMDLFTTDGFNAIYMACLTAVKDKTVASVINLIRLGADIDTHDRELGRTALHIAAQERLPEIVRFLVLSKADVNAGDHKGSTIMHIIARNGDMLMLDAVRIALAGGEQTQLARDKEQQEVALDALRSQADVLKLTRLLKLQVRT